MGNETTTDHGFIRAWAEAREGRPAMIENGAAPILRFDFGTPEPDMVEIAWDEFFTMFEQAGLALEFREDAAKLSHAYRLIPRGEAA